MRKRKILRFFGIAFLVILGVLVFLSITGTVAHAAGLVDSTVSDANAYSKYPLENYQLDFYVDSSWDWLPWNWLDGIGKSIQYGLYAITNFVWTVSLYISNATGYVVQEAYKLDFISDTASSIGKNIQTLAGVTQSGFSSEGFYVGFLLILILVMGIYIAYTGLIKRETTKAVHAVVNFLVVFILSASFIAYAPNYISKINDFSADISSSALSLGTKIVLPDSSSKGKDSVDLIRDSLFSIQVKQPWLLLQYGESDIEKLGSDRVESLLEASPDTDDREEIVVEEIEDKDNENLSVTKTMSRLGTVVFLFIFNIGISIFVFLLTGMMIFSQVLFIIYAMFLPVSFILSMIPTYEGMAKKALTKLFNTIMLRAGITLIITTAFSISAMFYSISSGYPFFMVAFLQIVTFAGIYFKLGDLMAMFSLQSSDTQQVGRRIMRRPYMFLGRSARRLERKIGRTVAAGAAGGVAGAVVASNSHKADTAKGNNHTRPNHDTASDTSTFGKRAGAKVGAVLDGKDRLKDKAKPVRQQVKDMPTQAQYAVHSGVNQIQENVSDFKRGIVEEKATRKQGRAERQDKHRQTVAEKRMELDKAKESTGSVTKGTAPVHERPVTTPVSAKAAPQAAASKQEQTVKERPASVTREQSSVKKEPVTKQQDNVRTQVVRESSPTVKQASTAATKQSVRQTVQHQKQTKTIQKKTTNPSTVKKTSNRKGGKK
ncbi:YtxH domain-containing protein [Blautia faecis]|uniref:CD3337/EF1877 family mobilome membrane protein n=1 Tax=Blautia faecis TaxID=871665 RepID=UPI0028A4BBB2|nr:YtxH domain-containing protein [Blautia faecis]MDT4367601.1 YtxH domain-containing protein [Blautia faecis]